MRRALTLTLLAFLTQGPAPTAPTGSIEGTVVRSDTGAPVPSAQVTLTFAPIPQAAIPAGAAATPPAGTIVSVQETPLGAGAAVAQRPTFQPVVTGPDGKFTFKNLAAGGYRVAAVADGYVRQEVGQRSVTGQGRAQFLAAGQTLKDVDIRLIPTGTISGRIYDENGQPATGAQIQLLRTGFNQVQGRTLQSIATSVADDRGEYRAFGVPPGRYYLIAGTPPNAAAGLRGLGGAAGVSARFNVVYYPNAENIDQAQQIEVKEAGQNAVDMRVRRQTQTYRVRGKIIDGTGAGLSANLQLLVSYRFLNGSGSRSAQRTFDPATGNFELQDVAPGDWTIVANAPQTAARGADGTIASIVGANGQIDVAAQAQNQAVQASRPAGSAPIKVVDRDIEGLVITMTTGVTVPGRLRVDGGSLSALQNIERMRLNLQPVALALNIPTPAPQPVSPDGSFQVVGMREGEYRVQFNPGVAGSSLYLKSLTYGGEDVLNKPLKFSGSGSGAFEVVLGTGAVTLSGSLTDTKSQPVAGHPVILIPAQRTRQDLMRTIVTDPNGRFSIANVPPGEYKAFSWESIDAQSFMDPDVLKQYEQLGKSVTVGTTAATVDVKLIPAQ